MNYEMNAKEKLSKNEKIKKKRDGYNTNSNNQTKNGCYEEKGNLYFPKYYEQRNNGYNNSTYDLINVLNKNGMHDDGQNNSDRRSTTLNDECDYDGDLRGSHDTVHSSSIYGNKTQVENYDSSSKYNEINFSNNVNQSLIRLFNINAGAKLEQSKYKGNSSSSSSSYSNNGNNGNNNKSNSSVHNSSSNNSNSSSSNNSNSSSSNNSNSSSSNNMNGKTFHSKMVPSNTHSSVSEINIIDEEKCEIKMDTKFIGRYIQNEQGKENNCEVSHYGSDESNFTDKVDSMYQEHSAAYQHKQNNRVNDYMDRKNAPENNDAFNKILTSRKKKIYSKDKQNSESNVVKYNNKDYIDKMLHNINKINTNNNNFVNVANTDIHMISEEDNIFKNDIAKKVLNNKNYLQTLNKNVENNDKSSAEQYNKCINVNHLKNGINNVFSEIKCVNNDSTVSRGRSNGRSSTSTSGSSNNTSNRVDQKEEFCGQNNGMSARDNCGNRGNSSNLNIQNKKLINDRDSKKIPGLRTSSDHVMKDQERYTDKAYNLMDTDSCNFALNNNNVSLNDRCKKIMIKSSCSLSSSSSSNIRENMLKTSEHIKMKSSLSGYDYCNYTVNNCSNRKNAVVNSHKVLSGEHSENTCEVRSSNNKMCILNNKKAFKSKKDKKMNNSSNSNTSSNTCSNISRNCSSKNNEDVYVTEDNGYYDKQKLCKVKYNTANSVGHTKCANEAIDDPSSCNSSLMKRTNRDQNNSMSSKYSTSDVYENKYGINDSKNVKKSLDIICGSKLVNINCQNNYYLMYNKESNDNYNKKNTNELENANPNETLLFNGIEKQQKDTSLNSHDSLLLKNVSYNDMYSSSLKDIRDEHFDYLKRNEESYKNLNFIVDAHEEVDIDDSVIYHKKINESVNSQSEESFTYNVRTCKEGERGGADEEYIEDEVEQTEDELININKDSKHEIDEELTEEVIEEEENCCSEWNENYNNEMKVVKKKVKKVKEKKFVKKNIAHKINGNDVQEDDFSKNKNDLYSLHYEDIYKGLLNMKNGGNRDELIKKNLLSALVSCMSLNKSENVQKFYNEQKVQKQNITHHPCVKRGALNTVTNDVLCDIGDEVNRDQVHSQVHNAMRSEECDHGLKNFAHFDNLKKKRKYHFKDLLNLLNNDETTKELRKDKLKELLENNANLQDIIIKLHEHNLLNHARYDAYDNNSNYDVNMKEEDVKNNSVKECKNKKAKKYTNMPGNKKELNEVLHYDEEYDNEKRHSNDNHDNLINVINYNDNSNDVKYVDELNSAANRMNKEEFHINNDHYKKIKLSVNYNEWNSNNEQRKIVMNRNEAGKAVDGNRRRANENIQGRASVYNSSSGNSYDICSMSNSHSHEVMNEKTQNDENDFNKYSAIVDELRYRKSRTDSDSIDFVGNDDEIKSMHVRNYYDNHEMLSNIKKYDSDDMCNKKYRDISNNEKQHKMYMSDIMKGSNVNSSNDNYFKLHSNLPSNLLSTSTSSSYSNDNLKISSNNCSVNDWSSNTYTNKYPMEENLPSNLNVNSQTNSHINKNGNNSYDKKRRRCDKSNVADLYNTSTPHEANINGSNIKVIDNDLSNEHYINQRNKQHFINLLNKMEVDNKATPKAALNNEYIINESMRNGSMDIYQKKQKVEEKENHEKEEDTLIETQDELQQQLAHQFNVSMNSSLNLTYHMTSDNFDENNKDLLWENILRQVSKGYEDKMKENSNNYGNRNVQFEKKMLFKSKSYNDNNTFLSLFLKRNISSFSDYKGPDVSHLHKNTLHNKNCGNEGKEFLLNRTNSLNINLNRVKGEQLDYHNEVNISSDVKGGKGRSSNDYGSNSNYNNISSNSNVNMNSNNNYSYSNYQGVSRFQGREQIVNSLCTESLKLSEDACDTHKEAPNNNLSYNESVVKHEDGKRDNEKEETANESMNNLTSDLTNGMENELTNELTNEVSNDMSNGTSNPVGSVIKNEIDITICTLANCPTHNPQSYIKNVSKKGDGQDGGMVKEENDELKRIPGVYYDKNSQRWFGEHKINGIKCAQSFAVKKHGCEEAKRLAIEWKKARIRGEVWDRFINKKKKSNSNNNCVSKASKSSRPSVEELRLKYLSMSKNMPKVRGVWFNSTPQRMGWVGQAYKKCKRIERIFSVNKYGFEGARKLAIAFRNSQKPSNEDSDEDSWSKDDKVNIKNSEENISNYEYKNTYMNSINGTKNENNNTIDNDTSNDIEGADARINLCRDALLFILHDLETILELNIPMLNNNINMYKICIKHHLNYLTLIKSEEQIIPYLNVFGDYIQRCILPTDLPYAELYVLIDSLIHNDILPSFDHKENFAEYAVVEDPGIITPSMLL
ncbi:AP2 domain transcription factor [Plasmodium brasilianum]|uniref:AP2 domain transcription factor n=1 Tax=Plasmodium brasilianum TaxID=5824 RepID=A0ACB9Y346_PLABR|nr:AP2 domain transcription factor [Plasmodium brasilianum]